VRPDMKTAGVKGVLPRVLIADDYPDMVKAVSRLLMLDFDVVGTVADGSALLEAAAQLQPDAIVLDVNLPGIDGLEACRRIRQAQPAIKVVVFTAMNDPEIRQRSADVGAAAFVSKIGGKCLLSTVKNLFDGR
jgi:CheY-like chemotaxis protein